MTLRHIIGSWLADNEFDGLVNPDEECGCLRDDLAPCDCANFDECLPAYKHKDNPGTSDSGFDWYMSTELPEERGGDAK